MRTSLVALFLLLPGTLLAQPRPPDAAEEYDDDDDRDDDEHSGPDRRDRIVIGDDLVIEKDERVRDAVAIGGDLTVRGIVEHDAVAIGGDLVLEPGSSVGHDAVGIGGTVEAASGVSIGHDRVSIAGPFAGIIQWLTSAFRSPGALFVLGILGTLLRAAMLLVVGLLVLSFAPDRVHRIRDYLVARPGPSAAAGLALFVGFVPLCVLLAITVVGIPLILVAVVMLAVILAIGVTALMLWLGHRLPVGGPDKSPVRAMLLGLLLVVLVDLVPFIGTPLVMCATYVAAGAVLLTRLGANGTRQNLPVPA
jgi:hypothetical protein